MIGKAFRVSIFGESHGKCVGAVIEGCPPGIEVNPDDIRRDLERRRPGKDEFSSPRDEEDDFTILSGVFNGRTTGAPITIVVWNRDIDSTPYEKIKDIPRPGHADYVARIKYFGFNDYRGGGIFSGRITAALVAAGSIAKKVLEKFGIEVLAYVFQIGNVRMREDMTLEEIRENLPKSPVACPDLEASRGIVDLLRDIKNEGDSIGGIIEAVALNVPVGLGEPPIDTLDGDLAKAMFVIPAVKGIEFGAGFRLAQMRGSEANDQLTVRDGRVEFRTNNAGGILGGMSNGAPIRFRVVIKPTPSILKPQRSVNLREMREVDLKLRGRFDTCIAIRAVPVVEAVFAIVLTDHLLRWLSWRGYWSSGGRSTG